MTVKPTTSKSTLRSVHSHWPLPPPGHPTCSLGRGHRQSHGHFCTCSLIQASFPGSSRGRGPISRLMGIWEHCPQSSWAHSWKCDCWTQPCPRVPPD